jgi:hypothetical protein
MDEFWSQEETTILKGILMRVTIDGEGNKILMPPLTRQEKAWVTDFIWRAMLWDFAEKEGSKWINFY